VKGDKEDASRGEDGGFISEKMINNIMKQLYTMVLVVMLISFPFLFSFFVGNYTATAIGIVILGGAITIIMYDQNAKSRSMVYMWIAIIILIAALLGISQILPKVTWP